MSINLRKGQKIKLKKEDGNNLTQVCVGLGWSPVEDSKLNKTASGFIGILKTIKSILFEDDDTDIPQLDIDIDSSVFMLQEGKLKDSEDVVYYHNLNHWSGAVRHLGDDLTGRDAKGENDNEQIIVSLNKVPDDYNEIVFVVNIYQARQRKQHFGMVNNCYIRIYDDITKKEFCRYNLSDKYDDCTAMIVGEIYKKDGEWKFNAIGQATRDNSIEDLAKKYRR